MSQTILYENNVSSNRLVFIRLMAKHKWKLISTNKKREKKLISTKMSY